MAMENLKKKFLNPEQAFAKAKHYCAYQERCHREVKEKLYSLGLKKTDVEELLARLIEEDYLNEERFAVQFAGGKFRIKHWGKVKINYELKLKGISTYNIKKALSSLDDADYRSTLEKEASAKWKLLRGNQYIARQVKTQNYLLQKGFELDLIKIVLQQLKDKTGKE